MTDTALFAHGEWVSRVKEAMDRSSAGDLQGAIGKLNELLRDSEAAQRVSVGSWHVQQCLGLLASLHEQLGDARAAAETHQRNATLALQNSKGELVSAGYALASAALQYF